MTLRHITFLEADQHLDWLDLTVALEQGHLLPKAQMQDVVLQRGTDTVLSRHAWIDGLGLLVKTATVFPNNEARFTQPNINGLTTLYSDQTGIAEAILDFNLVTKWKTAADSLLAARHLARPDSQNILIMGAGTVAASLIEAYSALFPNARFQLWNRTAAKSNALVAAYPDQSITVAADLAAAVAFADIVACGTASSQPVLRGEWLRAGQHVELIGSYLPSMREADDAAMKRARIFVDCRETTVDHIGELIDPIANGSITRADILGDFYDLHTGKFARRTGDEITLHKNGGGAHLDLMTSRYILGALT